MTGFVNISWCNCVVKHAQFYVEHVYIIGGTAVVSAAVEASLTNVQRIAGADRYATAIEVAKKSGVKQIFVARGDNFADALAGGALAAKMGGAIILVRPDAVPASVDAHLSANATKVVNATILGGNAAVSADVQNALFTTLTK